MVTDILANKKLLAVLLILSIFKFYSQTSGVGIGTVTPKALLDIHSTDVNNGGVLIPRYSIDEISTLNLEAEHDSMLFYIQAPANGIMQGTGIAANVNSPGYYYYDNNTNLLIKLNSSKDISHTWSLFGNNEANLDHFIGTTTKMPVRIKVNNTFSGIVSEDNVALGFNSLNNVITNSDKGVNNIAFGVNAIKNLTIGSNNIGLGLSALESGTIAEDNIAIGNTTLSKLIDGTDNIAIGKAVLNVMPSGRYNIGIGGRVMQNASGATRQNIGIGYQVLNNVSDAGGYNIGLGYGVLEKGVGVMDNIALGRSAASKLVTGNYNVTIGRDSYKNATTGDNNVAIGNKAAENLLNGNSNVVIGVQAMQRATNASNNIVIGNRSAVSLSTGTNNIIIGNDNTTSAQNISNEVTLGNQAMTTYRMWTNGWVTISDSKYKDNISTLNLGLDFINALKPSEFIYKNETTGSKSYGFIAQDIQDALKKKNISNVGLIQNFGDGYLGVRMNDLIPILTKAIQDQTAIINNQQAEIDQLKSEIQAIKAALNIK
jgi:trimeric autotransporter adhesin